MPNPLEGDHPPEQRAGAVVGRGRTAEVVDRGDGTVVKWFDAARPRRYIDDEAARSAAAFAAVGDLVGVPRVHGVVERASGTDRSAGIVFDRADGREMMVVLGSRPWRVAVEAKRLASLQAAILTRRSDALPELHDALRERIERAELPDAQRGRLLARLDALPRSTNVCHGDLHPGNVLLGPAGATVIDWANATRGDPAADLAQTWMLLSSAEVPGDTKARALIDGARRLYATLWWRRVLRVAPLAAAQTERWKEVVVAARLGDCPPGEIPTLRRLLAELGG